MFTWNIDFGQLVISGLIATVGFFIKRTVDQLEGRVNKHEVLIFDMHGDVKEIKGILGRRESDG